MKAALADKEKELKAAESAAQKLEKEVQTLKTAAENNAAALEKVNARRHERALYITQKRALNSPLKEAD